MKQFPVAQNPIKNELIYVKPLRLRKTLEFAQLNERRLGNTLGLDVLEDADESDLTWAQVEPYREIILCVIILRSAY